MLEVGVIFVVQNSQKCHIVELYGSSFAAARVITRSLMTHVVQAAIQLILLVTIHVDLVFEADYRVECDELALVLWKGFCFCNIN